MVYHDPVFSEIIIQSLLKHCPKPQILQRSKLSRYISEKRANFKCFATVSFYPEANKIVQIIITL